MCAGSTRPAVHPVSNPECLITAATCGECATYRGKASALRFICRRDAFGAGTTPAIGRSSPKDCQIWRVRRRGRPRVYARSGLVGYALGGLPGERLLHRLGIVRSDDTVLRRVKSRVRGTSQPKVRVLGVNDWAWRKRQRYGTMLMDLELLHVIDLLPVRSAESFAHWLGLHPEVEVITRDRSGLYADGGRQGAPSAVQITDRYHLVSNLGEAMERDLQQLQIDARRQLTQTLAVAQEKQRN